MNNEPLTFPPAVVQLLAEGTDKDAQRWLDQAADSLSFAALMRLEQEVYRWIDQRHPDNPKSVFNIEHKRGKKEKQRRKKTFDTAGERLGEQLLEQLEALRTLTLDYLRAMVDDALYSQRRISQLRRRMDQLRDEIATQLAHDETLHADLVRDNQAHLHRLDLIRTEHDLATDALRVKADLEEKRLRTVQPIELCTTLTTLALAAWEKQERDPTFRATFANLQELLGQATMAVGALIKDTDIDGKPLDEKSRQQATEEAVALVMQVVNRLIDRL